MIDYNLSVNLLIYSSSSTKSSVSHHKGISKNLQGSIWGHVEGDGNEPLRQISNSKNPFSHENPLLHSPTSKIHQDLQTPLWSRGNEIHHPDLRGRDKKTRRVGRSNHRISVQV